MGLSKYISKRDFNKTAEPTGGKVNNRSRLIFVIQKHAASHLHYDFRLEMENVLKSWAIPKGPTTDPAKRRLAMMVEDHPMDYHDFEGIIPEGEYGGGSVIVWDQGTYEPIEKIRGKKAQERALMKQLKAGSLKIVLQGQKLKGEFALVKTNGMGENSWLLIKHKDEFAGTKDVTRQAQSVLSGKTIEEIDKSPIPIGIKPMLATLVNAPFDDRDWVFEVKWDGYRALAFKKGKDVQLLSRTNKSFNKKFFPVFEMLKTWEADVVLDGEIMVINDQGTADFGKLQNWQGEADGNLVFYVFDLLWYNGKDVRGLALTDRQALLKKVVPSGESCIRLSQVFEGSGIGFFEAAQRIGLEGMIAKRKSSTYVADSRSKDWLKIKAAKRQEVVIAGFTRNADTPKAFSSLLLGTYQNGDLQYAGKVGTGFSVALQNELMEQFKPLITKKSPFAIIPEINKTTKFSSGGNAKATWLKPELVCEVSFTEITNDCVFRHPSFLGMREDKKAREVLREDPVETDRVVGDSTANDIDILLEPETDTQVLEINRHELKFTHLNKFYWPADRVTKRDLFNYYHQVAPFILPYLKDRPMSLNRFPGGINGKPFYQKDVTGKAPAWAKKFAHTTDEGKHNQYLVGDNEATLLWMANLGCIEMNPWFSRIQSPDQPDYCVIDLDPDQKNSFNQVIEVALVIRDILDDIHVPAWCKTSGSTGIHIYIPLGAKYSYDQSQLFAKIIVSIANQQLPDLTSIERMISDRKGKMYLDFLQNRPGATIACPYSLRPKPGATVSMPLAWDELKPGLKMKDFTIFNAVDRLADQGDLFKGVLGKGIDLEKTIRRAKRIYK